MATQLLLKHTTETNKDSALWKYVCKNHTLDVCRADGTEHFVRHTPRSLHSKQIKDVRVSSDYKCSEAGICRRSSHKHKNKATERFQRDWKTSLLVLQESLAPPAREIDADPF